MVLSVYISDVNTPTASADRKIKPDVIQSKQRTNVIQSKTTNERVFAYCYCK